MVTNYCIHNLISFSVVDTSKYLNRKVTNIYKQYAPFKVDRLAQPDFVVEIVKKLTPKMFGRQIIDDIFYINEDSIYCDNDNHKIARWQFEIKGIEKSNLHVVVSSNLLGSKYISGIIIDFLIHLTLCKKGISLIHASGLCNRNNAILFSGRGGTGKTKISLQLIEKGYGFLGDNYVIVSRGKVYGYPSPLSLFSYNLSPILNAKIGLIIKINIILKDILYKITRGYAKFFTKVDVRELFPETLVDQANLRSLLIMIPGEKLHIQEISIDDVIRHLVLNQKLEFPGFSKYLAEYSFLFPNSELAVHWSLYERTLEINLKEFGINSYLIEIPRRATDNMVIDLLRFTE